MLEQRRSLLGGRRRGATILGCALALLTATPALVSAQNVAMTVGELDGYTPQYIGYNSHGLGLRDTTWAEHADVNGWRFWLDMDPQGRLATDTVSSRYQFVQRRLEARSEINNGPLGNGAAANCSAIVDASTASNFINWSHYFDKFRSKRFTVEKFRSLGIEPVVQHSVTQPLPNVSDTAPEYWAARWDLWRHMFAVAYYGATHWNLTRYEIYNEPNIREVGAPEYVERLRLASDAIQLAIKTVNKRRVRCGGPTLTAKVIAPTTAGGPKIYDGGAEAWLEQPEPPAINGSFCNPHLTTATAGCYGRYVLQNRTTDRFYGLTLADADSFPTLFQGYAFHWYTGTQETYWTGGGPVRRGGQDLISVWRYLRHFPIATPQLDQYITEQNLMSHGEWASATPDHPVLVPQFAQTLLHDARANPSDAFGPGSKNVYIFRFQQSGNKENGLHHIGEVSGQVTGSTIMAEVTRLFARGFKDRRPRYWISSDDFEVEGLGSFDATEDGGYHAMVVNRSATPKNVTLDMNAWTLLPNAVYVRVDSTSPDQRNSASFQLMSNRKLTFTLPASGVTLVSAPLIPSTSLTEIEPIADATVKGGSNRFANYGTSTSLYAAGNATSSDARNATVLRFNVGAALDWSKIQFVFLRVYGQSRTTSGSVGTETIAHVYGLDNDAWNETSVTGANAPNIAFVEGPMTRTKDNFVTGVGETAHFLGHMTGHANAEHLSIDITDHVRKHPDRDLTFLIAREVRFDPVGTAVNGAEDTLTDQTRSLWMASGEASSGAQRPRLQIVSRN